jgi:hypothetical protein
LIYFIFRDDTYVVSSVFACLMIIGRFSAGVRILLEKGPSRHHISKIGKIPEKYQKIIFYQKTEEAGRRRREGPQGSLTTRGRGPALAVPPYGESPLAHYCHHPFAYFIVPKNLSEGGSEIGTAASAGRKTPEREKLSGRQKSAGEFLSGEGRSSPSSSPSHQTSSGSSSSSPSPAPSSPPSPRHTAVTS